MSIEIKELIKNSDLSPIYTADEGAVSSVYCSDLLSVVMANAPAGSAWVTVIGNANAVAVAVLAEVACIVIAGGSDFDESAVTAAKANGVTLLKSSAPIYETAVSIGNLL